MPSRCHTSDSLRELVQGSMGGREAFFSQRADLQNGSSRRVSHSCHLHTIPAAQRLKSTDVADAVAFNDGKIRAWLIEQSAARYRPCHVI